MKTNLSLLGTMLTMAIFAGGCSAASEEETVDEGASMNAESKVSSKADVFFLRFSGSDMSFTIGAPKKVAAIRAAITAPQPSSTCGDNGPVDEVEVEALDSEGDRLVSLGAGQFLVNASGCGQGTYNAAPGFTAGADYRKLTDEVAVGDVVWGITSIKIQRGELVGTVKSTDPGGAKVLAAINLDQSFVSGTPARCEGMPTTVEFMRGSKRMGVAELCDMRGTSDAFMSALTLGSTRTKFSVDARAIESVLNEFK